jgi:hypothetical protein
MKREAGISMHDVSALTTSKHVPLDPDGSPCVGGKISVAQAQAIGALDLESDRKNQEMVRKMADQATGKKVNWNSDDVLETFDSMMSCWDRASIVIHVSRVDPDPKVHFLPVRASVISDPAALHQYVQRCHGQSGAAKYRVSSQASSRMQRGVGMIYMSDTTSSPLPLPPTPRVNALRWRELCVAEFQVWTGGLPHVDRPLGPSAE